MSLSGTLETKGLHFDLLCVACARATSVVTSIRRRVSTWRSGARGGKQRAKTSAISSRNRHQHMGNSTHSTRGGGTSQAGPGFGGTNTRPSAALSQFSIKRGVWVLTQRVVCFNRLVSLVSFGSVLITQGARVLQSQRISTPHTVPYASNTGYTRHGCCVRWWPPNAGLGPGLERGRDKFKRCQANARHKTLTKIILSPILLMQARATVFLRAAAAAATAWRDVCPPLPQLCSASCPMARL